MGEQELGFTITAKDIYDEVKALRTESDLRIRKIEAQLAAQWVVISILTVGVGAAVSQVLIG